MRLNLNRPIAFIDLETTGKQVQEDRIVEISVCRLLPSGERDFFTRRVNPCVPIPKESSDVHGITDKDVLESQPFKDIARQVLLLIDNCDLAGYNSNRFDFPLLYNEFLRAGITWDYSDINFIDASSIFRIKEPRTLSAAYKFYCNKELHGAHGAEADISATVDVFLSQLNMYEDLPSSPAELALFCNDGKPLLDLSGKFTYNSDGEIIFSFGKNKDKVATENLDYVKWMYYKGNFNEDTHKICRTLLGLPQQ